MARRENLFKQQGGRCYWCKKKCHMAKEGKRMFTVDHLIHRMDPIRKTPDWHVWQRTVGACQSCNRRRGDEDQARWYRLQSNGNGDA